MFQSFNADPARRRESGFWLPWRAASGPTESRAVRSRPASTSSTGGPFPSSSSA